jgi:hypothetical protein
VTDPADGRVEQRIRINRGKVAARVVVSLVLLSAVAASFAVRGRDGWILGASAALVTYAFAVWPLLRASARGIAMEITDRGLVDHMGSIAFFGWDEIVDARLTSTFGFQQIEIEVRDVEPVLQRAAPLRRWFLRRHLSKHGGKLSLSASFIEGDAHTLLATVLRRRRGHSGVP